MGTPRHIQTDAWCGDSSSWIATPLGGQRVRGAGDGVRWPLGSAGCLPLLFLDRACSGSVSHSVSGAGSVSGRLGRRWSLASLASLVSLAPFSFGTVRLLSRRMAASGSLTLCGSRGLCDDKVSTCRVTPQVSPPGGAITFLGGFFPARLALRSNPPQKPFFSFCCSMPSNCRTVEPSNRRTCWLEQSEAGQTTPLPSAHVKRATLPASPRGVPPIQPYLSFPAASCHRTSPRNVRNVPCRSAAGCNQRRETAGLVGRGECGPGKKRVMDDGRKMMSKRRRGKKRAAASRELREWIMDNRLLDYWIGRLGAA